MHGNNRKKVSGGVSMTDISEINRSEDFIYENF